MNRQKPSTGAAAPATGYDPTKVTIAADHLNRGIAILTTVWLALEADLDDADIGKLGDTLYEGLGKLKQAEDVIGLYFTVGAA